MKKDPGAWWICAYHRVLTFFKFQWVCVLAARIKGTEAGYLMILIVIVLLGRLAFPRQAEPADEPAKATSLPVPTVSPRPEITKKARQSTPTPQPEMAAGINTYYVSTEGDDSNPGTIAEPWRTLRRAAEQAAAGDIVYVRAGVYSEMLEIAQSGTPGTPIKFAAYPGEKVVIDGRNEIPSSFTGLVTVSGSWVTVSGFEVRNSQYMGVGLFGQHVTVSDLYVHHSQRNGILIAGDYGKVQDSEVWRNSLFNEFHESGSNDSGLSAARDLVDGVTDHAVIKGNTVWENWGEGISSYEANGTIIEGNISHDNLTTNIYISDSTNVLCTRNLVFMDPDSYINGYSAHVGIMLGDERYTPPSAHIKVTNNIAYGNHRNFYWWQGVQGGGMDDVLVANNTFANSSWLSGVVIHNGSHKNVVFANNLILQDDLLPVIMSAHNPNITFLNNLWSKNPLGKITSPGDVIGDPKLARSGSPFQPDWFRLLKKSPAIGKASPVLGIGEDFFGNRRDLAPDLGAVEYIP